MVAPLWPLLLKNPRSASVQHHYWNYQMKQTSEVRIPSEWFLWTGSFHLSKGYSVSLIFNKWLTFSRHFYPKRLTVHRGNTFIVSMFPGNWTHNLCAATEPQEHLCNFILFVLVNKTHVAQPLQTTMILMNTAQCSLIHEQMRQLYVN